MVTVGPKEHRTFSFSSKPDDDGNYPRIRASARRTDDPNSMDSEEGIFSPASGASFAVTIYADGEIGVSIRKV